jgi:hypothetical protein
MSPLAPAQRTGLWRKLQPVPGGTHGYTRYFKNFSV